MMRGVGHVVVFLACACAAEGAVATPVAGGPARPAHEVPAAPSPSAAPAPVPIASPSAVATGASTRGDAASATADVAGSPTSTPAEASPSVSVEQGCVDTLDELPETPLLAADDRRRRSGVLMVVRKAARRLMLFEDGARTHCYRVGLGFAPSGHKQVEGDGRTPEGWYRTSDKPWSTFDNAIAIHYPNEDDARGAAADGRIAGKTRDRIVADVRAGRVPPQHTKLGGAVLVHGGGSAWDWTLGCVALDDADLLALRAALPRGMRTDMLIVP